MKRLMLAGGGHAHLAVLRSLAQKRNSQITATLVTPSVYQYYSGMLPGWMAGLYQEHECRVDLRPLCAAAGVEIVESRLVGMNADRRCVGLADGSHRDYDLLSLDTGAEVDSSWFENIGSKLLPVKPLDSFIRAWSQWLETARCLPKVNVVIVGGGAVGYELAAAVHFALRGVAQFEVELVAGPAGILPSHERKVRERALRWLTQSKIIVHEQRAVGIPDGVMLSDGCEVYADLVIIATGARAPCWLTLSKLVLDEHGYVAVDAHHRSLSHHQVFAAGDICTRNDRNIARSGVHAVHAGPVLACNLISTLTGGQLIPYEPRARSLYLLSCGDRHAIASWGRFSAEGRWVWRWKNAIDRRFIARHTWSES